MKRLLIANRGEIVKRVAFSAQKLGIQTVAIYAEDEIFDGKLPFHCHYTDFHACLGHGELKETYLNIKKIIQIAKELECDAIHPGYGFLSENSTFAKELEKNKITFVGPNIKAINLMGSKKESKDYVEKLGLPTIPGYQGDDQSFEKFEIEAEKIGYPVLLKASAGGGGKGMRRVSEPSGLKDAYDSAKREGLNSFGDDTLLIEKYLEEPRHIEFQVLSDTHGNHLHLFERECSIQRRHQKVIEESPSPTLLPELRKKMGEASVTLTSGLEYVGAGTIEYMVDKHHHFYFLEMNTRLQVEHPITEEVTGVDLVEQQLLVAQGKALALKQDDISQSGHSIELRLYAEDPDNNFLPDIGTVRKLSLPNYPGVRWEAGLMDGSEVSINYDPMIGKMIFSGRNRHDCIFLAKRVLKEMVYQGPKTNREYLLRLLNAKAFVDGEITTHFIETYEKDLIKKKLKQSELTAALAFLCFGDTSGQIQSTNETGESAQPNCWETVGGFRNV